jgi:ankyrin repeat protein
VAITRGDRAEVEELLLHGADPNALNAEGRPPLLQVIQNGGFALDTLHKRVPFVSLLLKHGADAGRTFPFYAPGGKMLLSDTLTARASELGVKRSDEVTFLSIVAAAGEEDVIGMLLAKSDVNRRAGAGMTALHWAALAGQPRAAYVLLKSGAAPDIRDSAGRTPLDLARRLNQTPVIQLLSSPDRN